MSKKSSFRYVRWLGWGLAALIAADLSLGVMFYSSSFNWCRDKGYFNGFYVGENLDYYTTAELGKIRVNCHISGLEELAYPALPLSRRVAAFMLPRAVAKCADYVGVLTSPYSSCAEHTEFGRIYPILHAKTT